MNLTDPIILSDLTPIEVPVTLGINNYVLREADAGAKARYRNQAMAGAIMGENGKVTGVKGLGDLEPLLVHLCLYDAKARTRVPLATILDLPGRVVKPLFERAKQISEIVDEEETVETLEKKLVEARERTAILKNGSKPTEGQSASL